jgi:RNA polymerase sigma-70 factor (ECF subfamily)
MMAPHHSARFERVYKAHYARLLSHCLRRGLSEADAHDAVEDVFLVVLRKMSVAPASDDDVLPWLFAITRRVIANSARTKFPRGRLVARLLEVQSRYGPDEAMDDGRRAQSLAMFRLLAHLRPGDREVLVLSAWDGLTLRQIAATLGCSDNAASLRLHRARHRLSELYEKETAEAGDKRNASLVLRQPAERDDI